MAKRQFNAPSLINILAAAFGGAFNAIASGTSPGPRTSGAYTRYLKKSGKLTMTDSDREALLDAEAKRERKNETRLYNARRCEAGRYA